MEDSAEQCEVLDERGYDAEQKDYGRGRGESPCWRWSVAKPVPSDGFQREEKRDGTAYDGCPPWKSYFDAKRLNIHDLGVVHVRCGIELDDRHIVTAQLLSHRNCWS